MLDRRTRIQSDPGWTLELVRPDELDLMRRLFELYLYDFSEMEHADVDRNGWFLPDPERYVARFWLDSWRQAFLLRVAGKPAGFVLVEDRSPLPDSGHRRFISAFFIMRAYRRRGLGEAMALATFRHWPGEWQVLQIRANPEAQRFWRRVIDEATGGAYLERWVSEREVVQEFSIAAAGDGA
ncbi:MAG: GNAT family N-acetyltransferase [Thermomicrobiales bacterium]